jgi:hypothetical protein
MKAEKSSRKQRAPRVWGPVSLHGSSLLPTTANGKVVAEKLVAFNQHSSTPVGGVSDLEQTLQRQRDQWILFANTHRIEVKPKDDWRCVEPRHGHINGFSHLPGVLLATNGILCYILQPNGALFHGHINWFIPLVSESTPSGTRTGRVGARQHLLANLLV